MIMLFYETTALKHRKCVGLMNEDLKNGIGMIENNLSIVKFSSQLIGSIATFDRHKILGNFHRKEKEYESMSYFFDPFILSNRHPSFRNVLY